MSRYVPVLAVAIVAFVWTVAVAPALASFALAAAAAVAWCIWLERHPEAPANPEPPSGLSESELAPPRLSVHVLATTPQGTRSALEAARRIARGPDARVVVLVPIALSIASAADPDDPRHAAIVDGYRALAADVGVHVTVVCCLCRRPDDAVQQLLGKSFLVILGGRKHGIWPGHEERLADRLIAAGYPVVFAQVGAPHTDARVPLTSS